MTRVAGILLAAGEGSRLGQPKALVELAGQTLAERGVAMLRKAGTDPVVLVTGAARAWVPGARTVRNLDWRTGMGSSLAAALYALETIEQEAASREAFGPVPANTVPIDWAVVDRKARRQTAGHEVRAKDRIVGAVIALADQPLVGAEVVSRLITAFAGGAPVVVAAYDGKPRNPVLIAREYWPAVLETATGDTGARPFLRAHPQLVTHVECAGAGNPVDIDTPEDLAHVAAFFADDR